MHFAKLRLSGFKSFVDPTELVIAPGVTGIVGPNGCGKSNLVEALSWVMGETSAKRMRGGEMDDVIFGGSTARPSRNMAEVALLIDNSRHDAPKPYDEYDELDVVRRIERGEGSGYRVNGREVRARDVQLLFADAATGAQSPAMVSQGRVSAVIAAKPVDRRMLLEEAAGIAGLHSRRHEAELRLKAAEANLLRLEDVLATMTAQLDSLRKQAKQAGRYRRLSDHIRRAEAVVLHLRWQAGSVELEAAILRLHAAERQVADRTGDALAAERAREAAAAELPALRQAEAAAAAELQRLTLAGQALDEEERRVQAARNTAEARLNQIAADLLREDDLAADARAAMARIEEERGVLVAAQAQEAAAQQEAAAAVAAAGAVVAALETELTGLTERVAAEEARRSTLFTRQRQAGERLARLALREGELKHQRAAIETETISAERAAAATEAVRAAEAEVERSRAAAETAEEALRAAQAAEAASRAPLEAAQATRTKLRAEAQALTELLAAAGGRRWTPILDSVQVAPGYEAALGAALGDDLTAPLDTTAPQHWYTLADYAAAAALPDGVTPLAREVIAPPALFRRLGQIGIVADAAEAERLQSALLPGQRLVSRDGGLWRWDGFRRIAGTTTAATQRLRQRNRLAELKDALLTADAETETLATAFEAAQRAARGRAEDERASRQAARNAVGTLADARNREAQLAREAAAIASKLAALVAAEERLATDLAEARTEDETVRSAFAELPDPALGREQLAGLRGRLAEERAQHGARRSEHDRLVREAQVRQQRLAAIASELGSWRNRVEAAARQRATLEERRTALIEEAETLARRPAEIHAQREVLAGALASARERRNLTADALASGETCLTEAERAAKAADAALAGEREERIRCEARRDQARESRQALGLQVAERLDCAPEAILATAGIAADETLPPVADATQRFERLVRERENMGPVNLVAESEAAEIEEKLANLIRERDDLTAAIAKLRQGIAALNREGRERLLVAFTEVNEHFTKLFVRLFGGGTAFLKLDYQEGDDPLMAGLEIMASPPGKKLQVLSLLSGGEQALTALSLLFAVFLTNPAPICVLDEVDAPLDDANVDRFCTLVDEIAQSCETRFLVITHHRLTMSKADRLFGVTMAERGISQLVSVDLQQAERIRRTA